MAKGNLDARVGLDRNDEFGLLGSVLDRMADSVRSHLLQLEQKNRELAEYSSGLEAMVRERTAELTVANDRLSALAASDGLTGLANRRRLDEHLEREARRCARDGAPLSVAMIDVDYFKAYNDRYGHLAGDECLKKVAAAIAAQLRRPADLAARFGGEEFVAVLPGADAAGAAAIARAAAEAVRALAVEHRSGGPRGIVTVSCGVACAMPAVDGGGPALVAAADAALYEAKRGGRDRVEAAPADPAG